jgi:integrase
MKGCKPLTDAEIDSILAHMTSLEDRCLFILGVKTGFRISELLSLRVQDVVQYGKIKDTITVNRASMKGKACSRSVVLHAAAKETLEAYLGARILDHPLVFTYSRITAWRRLKTASHKAHVMGHVSTHSMRKSFAKKVYEALDHDLVQTQRAMGHANVQSTVSYLSFDQDAIDKAILG